MKRIAIIGGGPMGMEAALYGACAGFDVQLFERGRLAENVRQWGYIGLFTEWKRNRSPLAVRLLIERGASLPDGENTSNGDELAHYVQTLASLEPLRGRVAPQSEVISLTRVACLKSDYINDPRRAEQPFQLVTRGIAGERTHRFDAVIDATGVWQNPNFMGSGGAPCAGEIPLAKRVEYRLPDVTGREKMRFANKHTLIVGSGHSAASTLRSIGDLMEQFPKTRVTWAVRRDVPPHGQPYTLTPDDASPHRDALHRRANELARDPRVGFLPLATVQSVKWNGTFSVELECANGILQVECDNIAAHTGFRPGLELWRELQVRVHPATDAVGALADAIIEQNRRAGTGLSTGYAEKSPEPEDKWRPIAGGPELMDSGESGFFVVGIKSYGRDAGFLMHNGFRQIRDVWKLIAEDENLDLYGAELD